MKSIAAFLALVSACPATLMAGALNKTVLYVTQMPLPDEVFSNTDHSIANIKMSTVSAMQSPLADTKSAGRGGALWIRYADGTKRNLTYLAGYGGQVDGNFNAFGFQGANSIAVSHPSVHWSGTKAVFSMVVGAPVSASDTTVFHWQLYEVTNFAPGQTPVMTLVQGQPSNYNNLYPCYDTQDRIIFVSDAPHGLNASHYPQLDEYLSLPCNSGLWRLDRANNNELKQIVHAPSGAFSPFIDSAGRVIFVQWDHLSRDTFATYDRAANTSLGESWTQTFNGHGTFASEASSSFTLGTPANYATYNFHPEPRNFDKVALTGTNLNGNSFNQFFPWECREDGSGHEVQNHVGRHEFSPQVRNSFTDDPNLITVNYGGTRTINFLQVAESAAAPGTYYAASATEFGTHAAGTLVRYNGGMGVNPDTMAVTLVTPIAGVPNPGLGQSELGAPVDIYRNPVPLSDGSLLAVHTAATIFDSNIGPDPQHPRSRYNFRLRMLVPSSALPGATYVPDLTPGLDPTTPQPVSLSYYANGQLISYTTTAGYPSPTLWELDPVEVIDRTATKPAQLGSPVAGVEQQVFTDVGVDIPTFQNYLKQRDLAVVVNRNSTHRDAADKQQPYNLKVAWSNTQTLGAGGKIYDIGWVQLLQADALRGYTLNGQNVNALPVPGRRLMPAALHSNLNEMPAVPGAPSGSVKIGDDGSWAAVLPAGRALTWQMLDGAGTKSQVKERYWVSFAPGEVRTCAVCHGVNTLDQAGNPGVPTNKPDALVTLLQYWKSNNPPGSMQHANSTSGALKNAGSVTLPVKRTGGSVGPVSVNFATANGSASAGTDYAAASGTLNWVDGDTADKNITIALLNPAVIGASKTLTVNLSAPVNGSLGATVTNTLTIDETAFNAWLFSNFGANANTPAGNPLGDPDGDGIKTAMEYALGGNPASGTSAVSPVCSLTGSHLELSFTRSRFEVTYTVEVSSDLATWTAGSTYGPGGNTLNTAATNDVTPGGSPAGFAVVRDNTAMTGGSQRFMRLRVTLP